MFETKRSLLMVVKVQYQKEITAIQQKKLEVKTEFLIRLLKKEGLL